MIKLSRDEAVVLQLEGRICGYSSDDFIRSVTYWSQTFKSGKLLLDFSRVESIDSMGAEAIAELARRKNIVICSLPYELLRMLGKIKEELQMSSYGTVEEAMQRLKLRVHAPLSPERRHHTRVSVCAPTKFIIRSGDQEMAFRGVVTDLSEGGALIEYLNKCEDSANFAFAIGLPVENIELLGVKNGPVLRGSLARISNDHCQVGLGVRFDAIHTQQRNRIAEYIQDKRSTTLRIETKPPSELYSVAIRPNR